MGMAAIKAGTPIWANLATVRKLTGVCDRVLMGLVVKGIVDMRKLGDRKQSTTVYRMQQILDWIEGCPNPKRVGVEEEEDEDLKAVEAYG